MTKDRLGFADHLKMEAGENADTLQKNLYGFRSNVTAPMDAGNTDIAKERLMEVATQLKEQMDLSLDERYIARGILVLIQTHEGGLLSEHDNDLIEKLRHTL